MTNKNLKQSMNKEWQKVRKSFHYPQLPQPQLVDNIPNGVMNIKSLEMRISEPFINELQEKGIEPEESLNEVLTHELTHFMKYPGSVLNTLRLQRAGQDVAEGDKISELRMAFTEAQTNIYMLNELKHPSTAKVRKAAGLPEEDNFGGLMYGLYQEVSGQDLGVAITEQERSLVDRLKDINYTDKKNETNNFRQFAQVLKEYQSPQQDQNQQGQSQGGQGEGQGEGEGQSQDQQGQSQEQQGQGSPEKGRGQCQAGGLDGFDDNQIREGLKQFAQECNDADEFEEIVRQVLGEGKQGDEQGKEYSSARGGGIGTDRMITSLASNFYTALAEKYTIPIRKKPMHKNGTLYPHSHDPFTIGDSIHDVDAFSSFGILPGITKKYKRKEGEVYGDDEAVPDSIILIDNSGSMPNPEEGISVPVLGATAISNAYLNNDSRVAVYSFGGNDHLTIPTRDKKLVHKELRRYSSGGTVFNPKLLESVLRQEEREFDISVVSDMGISNFDSFIETVLEIPKTHRVHLLYAENNSYVQHLREHFGNKENVAVLPLTYDGDIQKITMGEIKKSVF